MLYYVTNNQRLLSNAVIYILYINSIDVRNQNHYIS